MSNKTQLQTNNASLDGYIARVNAAKDVAANLPEAGGGGGASVEMCTGEIIVDAPNATDFTVWAVDENFEVATITLDGMMGGTFSVAKGTIIAVTPWGMGVGDINGECVNCFTTLDGAAFIVSGDFTLLFLG